MQKAVSSCLLGLMFAACCLTAIAESSSPRSEATGVVRELRRIVGPQGVERNELVEIGGIKQFISIRGQDRRNPVLLILHGGPGFPTAPMAWWATRPLEEYFTVVHWDQRGSGKTYQLSDPKTVGPTMRPEQFVADTEELVAWLRQDLGKEKVFLLGTSWGSYIGLEFARKRPEWLHAYIGMGQAANTPESERRGYAFALEAARKAGNAQAISELESIGPYAEPGKSIPLKDIALERKWSDFFGGVMAYRSKQIDWIAAQLSPDYTDAEYARVFDGNNYSQEYLFSDVLKLDLSEIKKLECPLLIFAGRHDRTVNSTVAHEWFETVDAPQKHFVWFENSGHEIMTEEPGKLLISLVQMARPIAMKSDDAASEPVDVAKTTYLLIYRPGPAWPQGKLVSELPLRDHGKYMLSLYAKGLMRMAGPLTDNAGGAVVLEVSDEAEAREIIAKDPAVKARIFVHELHPWEPVQWEKHLKK